ncbi:manganese efflux pump MntP [Alicyclobacillus acidiphilus]|uniref:manganese efflux pump MntP n=1 Tax=Alicyclobacillus acidiphilus TaxID=182455 RepID=UPI001FDF3530|nr:manganese efflux pump [Alicyclobacillus acidiphilus]
MSIGIGLGTISRRTALQLCICIGLFHVVFTFLGLGFGDFIGQYLGHIATWFGAALIIGLGLHMGYTTLFGKEERVRVVDNLLSMVLFSASVSIDALSVGFSLGLRSATYGAVSAVSFGFVSTLMCGVGLVIGKRFGSAIGRYGELLGAVVLIGCGIGFLM